MASRPSPVGLAPVPPLCTSSMAKRVASAWWRPKPPRSDRSHSTEVPSAGTEPGRACCRQPKTASGSSWPTMWRMTTGAGLGAFTIAPAGAVTRKGASAPALLGMSGARMHFRPNTV